tara:strand:+ start:537 stop:1250 length:714 start_codon:yes stop_codon:yes gene_type:complete
MKLKEIKRDKNGLLPSVNYVFNEDGFVDWRKMIKPEHLVPNLQKTSETDVTKLKDSELIILLSGIKELAQIRGYTDINYSVVSPSKDYVVVTCSIKFTPNYETEGKEVTFSGIGDAGPHNTHGFGQAFLGPIAENRAFVRAVRNFLRIAIVANEELKKMVFAPKPVSSPEEVQEDDLLPSPTALLISVMKEKNVKFDSIKKKLEKENYENAGTLESVNDIPKPKVFELIERLKKVNA